MCRFNCKIFLADPVQGCTEVHERGLIQPYKFYTWNLGTGNPFLPCILPFIPSQSWCKCHHLKAPYEHNVITWCSDDVMSTFGGKSVHAPGHLSRGSCSEWDAKVAALVAPSLWRGKWWPQEHTVTLSPWVLWCALMSSQPGCIFIRTCIENYIQECKNKALSLFKWLVIVW